MTKKQFAEILNLLQEANPNAQIELDHENAFQLLISVVLSAQSTDKQVNKITPAIFKFVQTPQDLIKLGQAWLREKIASINYNNTKAKNIYLMAETLVANFGGEVPKTLEGLESLSGVGRKSANVVLNSAFGIPTLAVDTHVFRVCNRTGLAKKDGTLAKNVLETEKRVFPKIPKEYGLSTHHLLVLHGRYVCKAVKPQCKTCVIEQLCEKNGV